ncbi:MAG: ATP-binding protein [Acidimicrobiia bacterium]
MPPRDRTYIPRLVDAWLAELVADVPAVLLVGPRASGKTTTASRLARTVLRIDDPNVRAAVAADPDSVLRDATPPALVDEWQLAPEILAATKRLVDDDPSPGRLLLAGSAADDINVGQWPGTGRVIRVPMWGLTQRELRGAATGATFIDRLIDAVDQGSDVTFPLPPDPPDNSGYVELAVASGFPEALARSSARTRAAWLDSYLDHLIGRDLGPSAAAGGAGKLRRYLRTLAASTAGSPALTTLTRAADLDRRTIERYDALLERLFVTEQVPAWSSNRLTRITQRSKRYVCDAAIAATALGVDRRAILRDADLLGRIMDTFVASQLRPELSLGDRPASMYHLREQAGRREVDLVIERRDGALVAIEIKAATLVEQHDARHLAWFREQLPAGELRAGVVFYTGTLVRRLDERIWAVPICALWG